MHNSKSELLPDNNNICDTLSFVSITDNRYNTDHTNPLVSIFARIKKRKKGKKKMDEESNFSLAMFFLTKLKRQVNNVNVIVKEKRDLSSSIADKQARGRLAEQKGRTE